jgi:CheY-like chemotaxis protein
MILLVDDDVDDLELFQEVLDGSDYAGKSEHLTNGKELMDLLSTVPAERVEVIVLDLNMPIKNGFEVLEEVKTNDSINRIPIVVLSASSSKSDETKCFELGCRMFARKPNTMQAYKGLIDRILDLVNRDARLK